jgi:hypothetical protein
MTRNNAPKTRGRPFQKGNPGRPKGSRHKYTLAAEALLDGESETLTRKAIELAKAGDMMALRLCLERIAPPRRDRPIYFEIPPMEKASDAVAAVAALVAAVANGEVTPSEASDLSKLVDSYTRTLLASDLEARVTALEEGARKST